MRGTLLRWSVAMAIIVVSMVSSTPLHAKAIEIQGLRSTYGPESIVKAVLRNVSVHRIEVNVAVEQLTDNGWREVFASITDREHPFGKAVKLTPINSKALLPISFKPLEKHFGVSPFQGSSFPLTLRLRVDVSMPSGEKTLGTVWSQAFSVVAGPAGQN